MASVLVTEKPSTARRTAAAFDRILSPIHALVWRNPGRRVQKLLRFSETEIGGGRDILRAAELTSDPLLRRLYMVHSVDEHRHGTLFRRRASVLLRRTSPSKAPTFQA